jgi:hypothetical protein
VSTTFGRGVNAKEELQREDQGPILGAGGWHFATLLLLVIGVIVATSMWKRHDSEQQRIALIIAGICAIPAAFTIVRVVRLFRRIGRATLILPQEDLPLGFSGNATYVRPLRGGATVESLEARLQLEEELTKGSGRNKNTTTKVVFDQELKPVMTPMMEELRVQIPLRIPEGGPASFQENGARLRWMIRLRLRMNGCPNTRSSFIVDVLPAVVKR